MEENVNLITVELSDLTCLISYYMCSCYEVVRNYLSKKNFVCLHACLLLLVCYFVVCLSFIPHNHFLLTMHSNFCKLCSLVFSQLIILLSFTLYDKKGLIA